MKNVFLAACLISAFIFGSCAGSDSPGYDSSLGSANATKPVTPVTIADTLLSDTSTTRSATVATATPVKQGSVTVNSAPVVTTTGSRPAAVAGKAGLNPAHGQPGHRCDIAVGAPLNSPPQSTQPVVTTTPVTSTPVKAAVDQASPAANGVARINPPHGQPGHDCSVQVGAPLKN